MRRLLTLSALLAGLVAAAPAGAVVGGTSATMPYPFIVALEHQGDFICGGSLVAPQLVLTAAHCVTDGRGAVSPASQFRVQVGVVRRSERASGDDLAVARIERHEAYGKPTAESNDVALLTLAAPSTKAPVALATDADFPAWAPGRELLALGWGVQIPFDPGLTVADDLRQVYIPRVADPDCTTAVGESFVSALMLCAAAPNGGRDTCQGDSGGPLLTGDLKQVGVVSFGFACGLQDQPGVYAKVGEGALRDWVRARVPALAVTTSAPSPAPGGPPAAVPQVDGCVSRRLALTKSGLPGLRLGKAQRGNGSRCVDGGGRVELRTRSGRLALVVTTARGHRAGTVRVGGRAPRTRTKVAALRRVGAVFAYVRNGKVVALAAADLKARRDVRALARRIRDAAG